MLREQLLELLADVLAVLIGMVQQSVRYAFR